MEEPLVTGYHTIVSKVDYIILGIAVLIPFAMVIWTAFKTKNTTQDFFTAKKSMDFFTVALSFVSTSIHAFMIMVYVAEIYAYGLEWAVSLIGGIIGVPLFTYITLKVFYDLEVSTIYEYLELRYHSPALRIAMVVIEVIHSVQPLGVGLAGSALILEAITYIKVDYFIYLLGILCSFYATLGGMRGVIWTDAFMLVTMIAGLIAVIVVGFLQMGLIEVWDIATQGGRTNMFNFNPSIFQRQNFYILILYGIQQYGKSYSSGQSTLQRAYAVKNFTEYKKTIALVIVLFVFIYSLMCGAGLTAYSLYAGCDPLAEGRIRKIDQILPYLISDKMGHVPGLPGLFLAAMVCAGMSSVTSTATVFAQVTYSDLLCKIDYFNKLSRKESMLLCKTLTFLTVIPSIGIAIAATKAKSMLPIAIILSGVFSGPKFGIFYLALLFPTTGLGGAIFGFASSFAILLWMALGRLFYTPSDEILPVSAEFCNSTNLNPTLVYHLVKNETEPSISPEKSIYDVSYMFYSIFGPMFCVLGGLLYTYIRGAQKADEVPPELISPIVRGLYYKKERKTGTSNGTGEINEMNKVNSNK